MKSNQAYRSLILFFASFCISIILLSIFVDTLDDQRALEETALLEGTTVIRGKVDGKLVHCFNSKDAELCLKNINKDKIVLWLGNSQLHSINQISQNDQPAPSLLHKKILNDDRYLVTFSQANANLQEHLILTSYMVENFDIDTLILPIFFDDLREDGVRSSIMDFFNNQEAPDSSSEFLKSLIMNGSKSSHFDEINDDNVFKEPGIVDMEALDGTPQKRVEAFLTTNLSKVSQIWEMQGEIRARLIISLYKTRNYIFGIDASTVRKLIPARYEKNINALSEILTIANNNDIQTLIYIPPLRNDYKRPYDESEYKKFKKQVRDLSINYHVNFSDLEGLVPNELWGMKGSTTVGKDDDVELDFMHFQMGGHVLLAEQLYTLIKNEKIDGDIK